MKILAIDTATERCSVALLIDGRLVERTAETPRGHADLVLPMVAEVLQEGGLALKELDGIAYGRGPGAFTGVRIAVGVVQGLAFGAQLNTAGISDLAAVAQQTGQAGDRVLVCMDARMGEVYWAAFTLTAGDNPVMTPMTEERVDRPENVVFDMPTVLAGTGFKAHPQLALHYPGAAIHDAALPRAREIALLGAIEFQAGRGWPASAAQPVYLRDQVAFVKSP